MSVKTGMSRRQFLGTTAAVVGAAALPAVANVAPAVAAGTFPFAIDAGAGTWIPLDPKAMARQGYEAYKGKWAGHSACCEASYWPIVSVLATRFPTTWGTIPNGTFNYGGGGVAAWGCICGCPNGGTALLTQMNAPANVKNNFLRWYEKTALPTNACYEDFASGTWTPGGSSTGWGDTFTPGTAAPTPLANVPRSASESLLCHASLTKWRAAADQWMLSKYPGKDTQSDRCGKLVYDTCFYLATLINNWKSGAAIDGAFSPAASSAGCKAAACHGSAPADPLCDAVTAQGSMNCSPCHTL